MNKYKNIPEGGYKSRRERDHSLWLESERRAGRIKDWQYEVKFELFAYNGYGAARGLNAMKVKVAEHYPDFLVEYKDGRLECHEIKALITKTAVWNLKRKLFEANYPHINYIVFDGQPKWQMDRWTRTKK